MFDRLLYAVIGIGLLFNILIWSVLYTNSLPETVGVCQSLDYTVYNSFYGFTDRCSG